MGKVLVIIDMQNEYVDENGRAPINGAKDIENGIMYKVKEYEEKGKPILYTINTKVTHEDRDKAELEWAIKPYGRLEEALGNHHMIKKTNYAISAEKAIETRDRIIPSVEIKNIEFVGVETNICVLANGVVFQNLFPDAKIVINSKLCASSNDILHSKVLDIMNGLRMEVI